MTTLSYENMIQQLQWRYAVKKFDAAKKISAPHWQALEDSLILTPSSYGLQPWKFIVVQNPEIRAKLLPASWGQKQVVDCSHFVVLTSRISLDEKYVDGFLAEVAKTRGVAVETLAGYRKGIAADLLTGPRNKIINEWAIRQVYIALGNLMTCAAMVGVDTCPMEGIDPVKYDAILDLENSEYRTAVACAVGYRSSDDKYSGSKKVRFNKHLLIKTV